MKDFLRAARDYVNPDARYRRLASALCSPPATSFGHVALLERPAATYTVEIEIRYRDANGNQIGDCLGFELLSEEAAATVSEPVERFGSGKGRPS